MFTRSNARGIVLAGLLLAAMAASAIGIGPLPQFSVVGLDGAAVDGSAVAAQGKWLLIYVQGDCEPCHDVLQLFRTNEKEPVPAAQIAIIVGGSSPQQVAQMKRHHKSLKDASWYADPRSNVRRQLGLTSAPVVMGLRDHAVVFSTVGALADSEQQKKLFLNWLLEQ